MFKIKCVFRDTSSVLVTRKIFLLFMTVLTTVSASDWEWTVWDSINSIFPVDERVAALRSDQSGGIWLTTEKTSRVLFFDGIGLRDIDVGYPSGGYAQLINIFPGPSGTIWFTHRDSGAICFTPKNSVSVRYSVGSGIPSGTRLYALDDVYPDRKGRCWYTLGPFRDSLLMITGNTAVYFDIKQICGSRSAVSAVAEDKNGEMWFGLMPNLSVSQSHGGGVLRYNGSSWRVYDTISLGRNSAWIATIAVDPLNRIWYAPVERGAICMLDGDRWIRYDSTVTGALAGVINSVVFDKKGDLWGGSYGGGLYHYDGTRWSNFTTSNSPVVSNCIENVTIDMNDNIWLDVDGKLTGGNPFCCGVQMIRRNNTPAGIKDSGVKKNGRSLSGWAKVHENGYEISAVTSSDQIVRISLITLNGRLIYQGAFAPVNNRIHVRAEIPTSLSAGTGCLLVIKQGPDTYVTHVNRW